MNWVKTCLNNRLIVYVLAITICIAGLVSLYLVPLGPFPAVNFPIVYFQVQYPGANAQTVQQQVVDKISYQLQSMKNLRYMTATAQAGNASISLQLESGKPLDLIQAQLDISKAIAAANLPQSVKVPMINIRSGESTLIDFALTSPTVSAFKMQNFIANTLVPRFKPLPGVKLEYDNGSPNINIALNPLLMDKYGLNPLNVANLINSNYRASPLGQMDIHHQTYLLNVKQSFNSLQSFKHMIVGYQGSLPIFLSQIATIAFEPRNIDEQSYSSLNGQVAAGINLNTKANANLFKISKVTRAYTAKLNQMLKHKIKITPLFDQSVVMKDAMVEVGYTIFIASLLVLLVAWAFLGHLKTTLIPIITIPVCLIGSIIFIDLFNCSINLITLLAMVIAVGLVVDDAIVVVENITRYIEQGLSKTQAIITGTSRIALTIIGITLTLLAVYLPILFANTPVTALMRPFAVTLSGAVLISGIVALTLTPVMALTLVKQNSNAYQKKFDVILHRIINVYHRMLEFVIAYSKTALVLIVLLLAVGGWLVAKLPSQIFPLDPSGGIKIIISGSATDSVESMRQKAQALKPLMDDPRLKFHALNIMEDPLTGLIQARINLQYKMKYLTQLVNIQQKINQFIKSHHLKQTFAAVQPFLNSGDYDVMFYLSGNTSLQAINQASEQLTTAMQKSPAFLSAGNTISKPQKQLMFAIDRIKAARYGISRQSILNLLSTYYGGYQLNNNFTIDGLSVPILVRINKQSLKNPASLKSIMIQNTNNGNTYPLSQFVTVKTIAKPLQISTFDGHPSVEFFTKLAQGHSLGEAINVVKNLKQKFAPQLSLTFINTAQQYIDTQQQNLWLALLGTLCIYLLLTLIFRNIADPFIIMLTVPFSVIGGGLSLYLVGGSINIFSTIGLLTLVGLITKHGVLIVQFANREIQAGHSVKEAILAATTHRFRPIIMTTLAMTFGALPLVFSSGIMYESRRNLGIVIIGGLIIGTLFSLFIVPVAYLLIKRAENKVAHLAIH